MLEGRGLSHRYAAAAPPVLRDLSIAIAPGEVVGLRGRSGVGKSTLGRILSGHLEPQAGTVLLDREPPPHTGFHPVQMLFQSAELAVNPRWKVRRILCEAFVPEAAHLRLFGIREAWLDRYPHELSGGELQRIGILRALHPKLRYLVADEISAMLDPITQAEIWAALLGVARARRIGMLVIAHDRSLLDRVANRVLRLADGAAVPA